MKSISNIVQQLQRHFFDTITSGKLVYNTCWEDPRIDRALLNLDSGSNLLMLTSAGDNALDYLLDDVRHIQCVDINATQNTLLELKKALFKNGNYTLLWDFFGEGKKSGAELIYRQQLRALLPRQAQQFWDTNIQSFSPQSIHDSFYFSGTSGRIAHTVFNQIERKGLGIAVENLLSADSLEEQAYYFNEIEPQLWNPFLEWLIGRHTTMTMLGVPASQRKMIEQQYEDGLLEFIRQSLHRVFTKLPVADNYFWRVYLTGHYISGCCPNYLRKENFQTLRKRIHRIEIQTSSLLQALQKSNQLYSHFVLLDHQDWMAFTQPDQLTRQWRQILNHAQSGARILFRSAMLKPTFLPDFVFDNVRFHPALTKSIHKKDRVGTYESTHLATVL
jgi:S-adenosylmethionine-diacylglycerol 3-amino-3-carboxypropyl transferase